MIVRFIARGAALALPLLIACAMPASSADTAAAQACAANLPKDAKAIFDKTLPQVGPDTNLRDLLTTNTRSLAMSGAIGIGSARASATAASECLQQAK
jgi:hypothetical protein